MTNVTVNINGGIYNINGTSNNGSIDNGGAGVVNICNGQINGLATTYELYNQSTGYIYYKSSVKLKNNKIYDPNSHVIINDSITCE